MSTSQQRYLDLLAKTYPTKNEIATTIITNQATCSEPKETELFISDVHGEYESFANILRSGCGLVKTAIDQAFQDALSEEEKQELLCLICYPKEKTELVLEGEKAGLHEEANSQAPWTQSALLHLTQLCKYLAQTHSYAQVQERLSAVFRALIEELLFGASEKQQALIEATIQNGQAKELIVELALLAQRLCVDKLHVVGDIYDRGPLPDLIMEELIGYHNVDIQWGNHDILWMGAALGQRGSIANVVRICARYGNLSILSDSYGINLLPLITFAMNAYQDDPCVAFGLKGSPDISEEEKQMSIKVQKAMAILQFKVEAQLIAENPSYHLEDRNLLDKINYEKNTVVVDGTEYALTDTVFPTVDPADPYRLTEEEAQVIDHLERAFTSCEKLQRHIRLFLDKGSLYKIENNVLMFHACVPLNEDGSLKEVNIYGETYKGKALFDAVDGYVRAAYTNTDPATRKQGLDLLWYLWLGEGSPLFAKSKMATFELYLIAEKPARKEVKNTFYSLLDNEEMFDAIFKDFGMDPETSHIVCGHVPVKVKDGEDPVKCNGKAVIIDGGLSRAYQATTGVAGFTLISDTKGITLATHDPFAGTDDAIANNTGVHSTLRPVALAEAPLLVADTDQGAYLAQQNEDLKGLL